MKYFFDPKPPYRPNSHKFKTVTDIFGPVIALITWKKL